jgi:hypothetical protein
MREINNKGGVAFYRYSWKWRLKMKKEILVVV